MQPEKSPQELDQEIIMHIPMRGKKLENPDRFASS